MNTPKKLVIASRESMLAMWQAEHIKGRLKALYPDCEVEILGMTTRGDQILDRTLSKIGGKGLFIKELEQALQDGRADLAVHSIKDVPMELPEGFALAAIGERASPFDAFVSNQYARLEEMPEGAIVGTSSLRREAQLRAKFPHLTIQPLRGNVQTRLSKLDNGDYDAVILAAAGLQRLGLDSRIREILSPADSLPAAGQGALGIEIAARRTDLADILRPLNHEETAACVTAERALARALGGSCQVPLAAYCVMEDGLLTLNGLVGHPDGSVIIEASAQAPDAYANALGRAVAKRLADDGAEELIAAVLAEQQ
ncbi:porphobilinogen deaminase [Neisseria elongata subsp. glycolytica ATCC 29315]|uniref:Porphobilinogen deaminase n=1 Tax=Neisseria elongata subsp. glycolytica ATCC 29315 TaxID=546263 RepID=D4DSR0_NEIEG|nr:hydroxymethylbilane synthase [Neisseria elongata]AJE18970.1 porphobilinogen deaminase [Neisseria elongata subsp. glycolytica ATCC 29315]EFE49094.1 hydroxymethylbilane synthase [Neisseria elongata subsp. glycolytica ATCC 29315]SQH50869.1 porphobilinogen deaminase [Neisseria elongata subsp. glycolytica]